MTKRDCREAVGNFRYALNENAKSIENTYVLANGLTMFDEGDTVPSFQKFFDMMMAYLDDAERSMS